MGQWPPSPMVEDEATSLAKEYGFKDRTAALDSDDQSVPSRGDVDQLPVIVDSDTNTETPVKEASKSSRKPATSKRADHPHLSAVFRDETGLPTPPPSDNEARGRPTISNVNTDKDEGIPTSRSKSTTRLEGTRQSRPTISRIHTDAAGELQRMKAGVRRAPSPYSYTRQAGTFRVDPTTRHSPNAFLSPTHATASPTTMQNTTQQQGRPAERRASESLPDPEQRQKALRFAQAHQGPAAQQQEPSKTSFDVAPRSSVQQSSEDRAYADSSNLYNRRRHARADRDSSGKDMPRKAHRSRSRPPRAASRSRVRDSPYSSSTDESVRSERHGSTKKSSSDERPVRRRSSVKRDRPRLEETPGYIVSQKKPGWSDDDATKRVYHVRDGRSPMTPPTVTTPNHMEDYFSQAFHENGMKQPRHTPRSSVDDTVLLSPPTSPPRTPRTERPSRQEYYESPSSSPRRTPQHSRAPSVDESQFRELKAHTSLLSQATSAAAVLASKTSPPVTRSASNAIETTFACSSNGLGVRPRSRAPSPQRERSQRSDTFAYAEPAMTRVTYPPVPQPKRPSTRDGLPTIELSAPVATPAPQRNATWTGYDQHYRTSDAHFGGPLPTAPAIQHHAPPPMYRSQSATTPQELTSRVSDFALPECPRSQPTRGLRDWCTIRDIPNLDICPSCTQALSTTRYRPLLVRGLEKPYDRSTVCSLSKPWVRIAFVQSLKQNKRDLSFVMKANFLPPGAQPCQGSRPDIRRWFKLIDPATGRAVPDFFACHACVGSVDQIFPNLPSYRDYPAMFEREDLNQEKVCALHPGSKHFNTFVEILDQIATKCRERRSDNPRHLQPFVDYVRRIMRHPECARDRLLPNRAWHFMNELPEFTICEACYEEVVWPQHDKPLARDISKVTKLVPHSAFRGSNSSSSSSSNGVGTHPVSCQIYSERMRRMFTDVVNGRISFEMFRNRVKERHAVQYRLTEMNRMYEEDQRMGWDRRADIEKNRQYWRSLE